MVHRAQTRKRSEVSFAIKREFNSSFRRMSTTTSAFPRRHLVLFIYAISRWLYDDAFNVNSLTFA